MGQSNRKVGLFGRIVYAYKDRLQEDRNTSRGEIEGALERRG